MRQLTLFLVDDDAAVRRMLTSAFSRRGILVEVFDSAESFLDRFDADKPGCLLLDLSMPGMTGLDLQRELVRSGVDLPIIFITGTGDIPQSVQAMKSGAIDFLEKPFDLNTLFERIDEAFAAAETRREAVQRRAAVQARFASLTGREQEVMRLLIADAANSSSKTIAGELGISHRTVDHHRARIMEKTRARSVTELARLADWIGAGEEQLEPH